MKCLFTEERTVEQKDPLLRDRGVLTIGLEPSPRVTRDPQSVYWALPLAHLRRYGRLPVTRVQSLRMTNRDRLTIDEMLWIMVSSYIQAWHDPSISAQTILQFVSNVAIELHYALGYDTYTPSKDGSQSWLSAYGYPSSPSWLAMLSRVCLDYKNRLHEERTLKLQALGRRLRRVATAPFNGIFNVETYLRAQRSTESKIKLLREMISPKSCPDKMTEPDCYEFLIVSKRTYSICTNHPKDDKPFELFEYLTAIPGPDKCDEIERSHKRWVIPKHRTNLNQEEMEVINNRERDIRGMNERIDPFNPHRPAFIHHNGKGKIRHNQGSTRGSTRGHVTIIEETSSRTEPRGHTEENIKFVEMQAYVGSGTGRKVEYSIVSGSLEDVALLRRRRGMVPVIHQPGEPEAPRKNGWPGNELKIQQILSLFQPGSVDFTKCVTGTYVTDITLQGMTLIESLYGNMGEATIDVRAVGQDFEKVRWVLQARKRPRGKNIVLPQAVPYLHAKDVDTATCFACIAMMESGSYNLDPDGLRNVFGLCASDSLYIASCLLQDPADRLNGPPIQRYTGNIGRAGMSFMVPPSEPEIRRYDLIDEWYQYDHNVFTGVMEDCFEGTSLHLSFSEASQAVNINFPGPPDVEAYFLETLISVYNSRREWIAELDILRSVTHPNLKSSAEILRGKACGCKLPARGGPTIISIDSFVEMLVPPAEPGIIRAKGNWQARLTATALCLAKGYKVVIKDPNTCLTCVLGMAGANGVFPSCARENKDVLMII